MTKAEYRRFGATGKGLLFGDGGVPRGSMRVSDVVRGMARSSAGVQFEDRAEQKMTGVGEPERVHAVR